MKIILIICYLSGYSASWNYRTGTLKSQGRIWTFSLTVVEASSKYTLRERYLLCPQKTGSSWNRASITQYLLSEHQPSASALPVTGSCRSYLSLSTISRDRGQGLPSSSPDAIASWGFVDAPIEPTTVLDFSVIFLAWEQFPADLICLSIDYDCATGNTAMLTGIYSHRDLHKLAITESNEPATFFVNSCNFMYVI